MLGISQEHFSHIERREQDTHALFLQDLEAQKNLALSPTEMDQLEKYIKQSSGVWNYYTGKKENSGVYLSDTCQREGAVIRLVFHVENKEDQELRISHVVEYEINLQHLIH